MLLLSVCVDRKYRWRVEENEWNNEERGVPLTGEGEHHTAAGSRLLSRWLYSYLPVGDTENCCERRKEFKKKKTKDSGWARTCTYSSPCTHHERMGGVHLKKNKEQTESDTETRFTGRRPGNRFLKNLVTTYNNVPTNKITNWRTEKEEGENIIYIQISFSFFFQYVLLVSLVP